MNALTKRGTPRKRDYPENRNHKDATPLERVTHYVDKSAGPDGCWLWTRHLRNGYGSVKLPEGMRYVHRVMYEALVGPIPDGLQIDHLCRDRACCNPRHLEPVTPQVNTRRGYSTGAIALRRNACLHGHRYTQFGAVRQGRRVCRVCNIVRSRNWQALGAIGRKQRRAAGQPIVDLATYFASPAGAAETAAICAQLLAERRAIKRQRQRAA